jgi:hypothetical protein
MSKVQILLCLPCKTVVTIKFLSRNFICSCFQTSPQANASLKIRTRLRLSTSFRIHHLPIIPYLSLYSLRYLENKFANIWMLSWQSHAGNHDALVCSFVNIKNLFAGGGLLHMDVHNRETLHVVTLPVFKTPIFLRVACSSFRKFGVDRRDRQTDVQHVSLQLVV